MAAQHITVYVSDTLDGMGTGLVDEDVADERLDEDSFEAKAFDPARLPSNWLQVTLTIKTPNPDHPVALQARETQIRSLIQAAAAQASAQGEEVDLTNAAQMADVRAFAEQQVPALDLEPVRVRDTVLYFRPDNVYTAILAIPGIAGDTEALKELCEELGIPLPAQQPQAVAPAPIPAPVAAPAPAPAPALEPVAKDLGPYTPPPLPGT